MTTEVKLVPFYVRRYVPREGFVEAELALRACAAKHHGHKLWLQIEGYYKIVHMDTDRYSASVLKSIYEVVTLP